jgi:hypothetical protein
MAYPYVRTTWQDRQVQNPMNFTATGTAAATQGGSIVLTPNEGAVTQTGTPLTAATMNNIEQGIVDLGTNKLDKTAKLDDISDVDLTGASAGDILEFDGVNWKKGTQSFSQTFFPVNDSTIPSSVYTDIQFGSQSQKNWSTSQNCYVVPVDGLYKIDVNFRYVGLTGTYSAPKNCFSQFTVNGVAKPLTYGPALWSEMQQYGCNTINLRAGDKVKFQVYFTGGGSFDGGSWSSVTISLLRDGINPVIPGSVIG